MDNYNNDTFLSNIKNSINYVIENHHKFILLFFVFVIIYFVDYITYINTIIYSPTPMPILNTKIEPIPKVKNPKEKRSIRKRK
jgi:hypothetical protein